MPAFLITLLANPLARRFAIGLGIAALIGIGLWWINDRAFNRGYAESERRTVEAIAELKRAVARDKAETRNMSDAELDDWFRRECLKAGGSAESCK